MLDQALQATYILSRVEEDYWGFDCCIDDFIDISIIFNLLHSAYMLGVYAQSM